MHSISPSLSQAHLVLIPKPEKDSSCPAVCRSISISNVDYEILAKILVHRLNRFIGGGGGQYIQDHQIGFLKQR